MRYHSAISPVATITSRGGAHDDPTATTPAPRLLVDRGLAPGSSRLPDHAHGGASRQARGQRPHSERPGRGRSYRGARRERRGCQRTGGPNGAAGRGEGGGREGADLGRDVRGPG